MGSSICSPKIMQARTSHSACRGYLNWRTYEFLSGLHRTVDGAVHPVDIAQLNGGPVLGVDGEASLSLHSTTQVVSLMYSHLPRTSHFCLLFLSSKTPLCKVEDCLFRTPSEPLEAESTVFRDAFLLPTGPHVQVSVRAESPSAFDTCSFACRRHGTNKGSDLDYDGLRNAAIEYLDCPLRPLDPITKVELALQYNIQEWLLSALLVLARRSAPISIEEGRRIGFENARKLASVREKLRLETAVEEFPYIYHDGGSTRHAIHQCNIGYVALGDRDKDAENLDYTPFIRKVFGL